MDCQVLASFSIIYSQVDSLESLREIFLRHYPSHCTHKANALALSLET
ncbi:MAG: hypothetical protein J1E28_00425 [Helicobacter sp.]|nr:hypothetical protein [Helicobacter sp.]MCH5312854.1 hypothetical protein [Helicobacter sp.]